MTQVRPDMEVIFDPRIYAQGVPYEVFDRLRRESPVVWVEEQPVLKITAGRQKDLDDCAILLPKTKVRTRGQAQQLLDRYILPGGQQKNAESIENALNQLFGREA